MIKPKALKSGDTVGIVAPASPPFEQSHIVFTIERLAKLGLKAKVGPHVNDTYSDYAGKDEIRLADFHKMWADPEVNAILPLRGGNGTVRLLPKLDFDLIAKQPKILCGFSDITGLLIPIYQKTGLVTFHGPTAGTFFESEYTHENFVNALTKTKPLGEIADPPNGDKWKPAYPPPRVVIAPGKAQGRLIGGCLTLIRQLMGTPYEIQTDGMILFFEDVQEEPHSIDRMLTQLILAGKLQKAKGIVIGDCVKCLPGESRRRVLPLNHSIEQVFRRRLANLGIPVLYGIRLGHGDEKITLPVGVLASLDLTESADPAKSSAIFKIEESATCD